MSLTETRDPSALNAIRDRLKVELAELDRLGEKMAAIELNAAIETLTRRLGQQTDLEEIATLKRRHFRD